MLSILDFCGDTANADLVTNIDTQFFCDEIFYGLIILIYSILLLKILLFHKNFTHVSRSEDVFIYTFTVLISCKTSHTAKKMKFPIRDFFSICDQIRRKLWIWSHLLKTSLVENFVFRGVSLKTEWIPLQTQLIYDKNVEKRLEKKAYANFNLYGVTSWETNNYNVHIAQYLKK